MTGLKIEIKASLGLKPRTSGTARATHYNVFLRGEGVFQADEIHRVTAWREVDGGLGRRLVCDECRYHHCTGTKLVRALEKQGLLPQPQET